jgi:hypothetical protein
MARPGLDRHPKFKALCRLLGEPRPHVIGYLELIWLTAYESGDPVLGTADMVEAVAEYPGERGKLFRALLECGGSGRAGFIEPAPGADGAYQIHDLFDHCPDYVKRRMEREHTRTRAGKTLSQVRSEAATKRWNRQAEDANDMQPDASDRHLHASDMQTDANGATPPP